MELARASTAAATAHAATAAATAHTATAAATAHTATAAVTAHTATAAATAHATTAAAYPAASITATVASSAAPATHSTATIGVAGTSTCIENPGFAAEVVRSRPWTVAAEILDLPSLRDLPAPPSSERAAERSRTMGGLMRTGW